MILVTGASGFLGSHLVQALQQQGSRVRAVYHSSAPGPAAPGTEWVKADLLDVYDVEAIMQGVDRVFHCAAIVSFSPERHEQMLHFNPESTANIVNQALVQEIQKMVYVSSVAALGRQDAAKAQITEEEQWGESKYNSAYALSKYMAETEVWRGVGEGLNAVIVNPSVILGEGNWNTGSAALMKIAASEFPFYTNGATGWVDVLDVVRILTRLMESNQEAERFIVSGGNHSFRQVFTLMANALGKRPPRYHAGPFLSGLVWRLGRIQQWLGKTPTVTKETAATAQAQYLYNNEKLLAVLGDFAYTPIEETINRMAGAYKAQQQY